MNDFVTDDEWQREKRDAILVPQLYERWPKDGSYVLLDDGLASKFLQKWDIDTLIEKADGTVLAIEEKIVRPPKNGIPFGAFCLETHSCTNPGYESDGWMRYSRADILLYCFTAQCGGLDPYMIDFPALQEWFWPREDSFRVHVEPEKSRAKSRIVKISTVEASGVECKRLPFMESPDARLAV